MVNGVDKGSSVVAWDTDDYFQETSRRGCCICKDDKLNKNIVTSLVEKSNKIFNRLRSLNPIQDGGGGGGGVAAKLAPLPVFPL